MRRVLLTLLTLALGVPAHALPRESCAAQPPSAPTTWTTGQLAALGATVVSERREGGVLTPSTRAEWSADGPLAVGLFTSWDAAAGTWSDLRRRSEVAFADADRSLVATRTSSWRATPADPFSLTRREVFSYDLQGRLLVATSQTWTGSGWAPDERVYYARHASGAFSSLRSEEWDGVQWSLLYRVEAAFDADGHRVLCELFFTDDAAAPPALRHRTSYVDGRPAAVITEFPQDDVARADSAAYIYDAEARYVALETYRGQAPRWSDERRTSITFDADGRAVGSLSSYRRGGGWRAYSRTRRTYRPDGLESSRTSEDVVDGEWALVSRSTYTSERQATSREAAPAPLVEVVASPNPTTGLAEVRVTAARAGPLRLDFYDATGRVVARVHDGTISAGPARLALDLRSLPAGTYVVVARTDGGRAAATVTVAR